MSSWTNTPPVYYLNAFSRYKPRFRLRGVLSLARCYQMDGDQSGCFLITKSSVIPWGSNKQTNKGFKDLSKSQERKKKVTQKTENPMKQWTVGTFKTIESLFLWRGLSFFSSGVFDVFILRKKSTRCSGWLVFSNCKPRGGVFKTNILRPPPITSLLERKKRTPCITVVKMSGICETSHLMGHTTFCLENDVFSLYAFIVCTCACVPVELYEDLREKWV